MTDDTNRTSSKFEPGPIEGVEVQAVSLHHDERGWLAELFREDDPVETPAMAYLSMTLPGVTRGPHEHQEQSDRFCFVGPSTFLLVLWDNRPASPSFQRVMRLQLGDDAPTSVIVPPGVVHAYRNVGKTPGLVVNLPDRLYRGHDRRSPVDEIRHEADPASPFQIDRG